MPRVLPVVRTLCVLAAAALLQAHEFWIAPAQYRVAPNTQVELGFFVGEGFAGEPRPFLRSRTLLLRHVTPGGRTVDLKAAAFADSLQPAAVVRFREPGTHVVAYSGQPSFLQLEAQAFTAYLQADGLEGALAQRRTAGTDQQPGRELYSRHAKTLVQVGEKPSDTHNTALGMPLELFASANPYQLVAGSLHTFELRLHGKPVLFAKVQAWHKDAAGILTHLESRTNERGRVTFVLPHAGAWLVSAVQMEPHPKPAEADWRSYWASLTFELAPAS